ncbi:ABC transporter permease [Streptomyces sp. NPDC051907]|uniref:ABC transporter permease n=1 Tax=Streptomyces sp. NPDC051907 TaxID=3155284 RepID=UPI003436093F
MNTTARRLNALGRAELTLLIRNRSALFAAVFVPLALIGAIKSTVDQFDGGRTGMGVADAAITGGIGMALLIVVYANLTAAYTARREELVLKRLRTGEASDLEILGGTALPAAVLALAQCALITAAGAALLDVEGPARPELLVVGVLCGIVLLAAAAAVTTVVTRTAESSQITTMPLLMVSALGSGVMVPLDVLPDKAALLCELLPLTGVMELVRAGWLGESGSGDLLGGALNALAWTVIAVFAVQRWFRWEPRR